MANLEKATKIGVASWAKINNAVDVYENNGTVKRTYQVILELNPADTEELKADIAAVFEEFKATAIADGKKFNVTPSLGYYEDNNGKTVFKFWTYSEFKATKDKEASPKTIPVHVVGKGILGTDKKIGNGSKIQVAYTASPFHASAKSFGVSLNLNKVLVHELIEFGGSSDDMSVFGVDVSGATQAFNDGSEIKF